MGQKKNQHFVPKCLLRQFGTDDHIPVGDRKQISMVNIERKKFIRNTSIKDQCAADYLYGSDLVIENALGPLEGMFNETIKKIISENTINEIIAPRWQISLMIAIQIGRTTAAEEDTNALAEKMARLIFHDTIDRETMESIKLTLDNAAALNVSTHSLMSPIMFDLKNVLIINKSHRPLIISDNPVCLTNWFFKRHVPHLNTGGTGSAGIQIFMPLSPNHMILLLDSNVYTTGSSSAVLEIDDPAEIDHLNRLQYLNSFKNIYFSNKFLESDAIALLNLPKSARERKFERSEDIESNGRYVVTDKDEFSPPTEGVKSELLRVSGHKLPECLRLRQIKIRSKPKFYDDGSLTGPVRDPVWLEIMRDFRNAIDSNHETFSGLEDFVRTHPLSSRIGNWFRRQQSTN